MSSFVGIGNQYIQLVKVLHCKLPTISKQLPTFPHKDQGLNRLAHRWEASVLPLHHRGPWWFTCKQGLSTYDIHMWNCKDKAFLKYELLQPHGTVWMDH